MADYLVISTASELLRLHVDEVLCVVSDGNYCTLVLDSGDERLITMQLGQMERLIGEQVAMASSPFVRVGKSLIVNQNHIFYINPSRQVLELSNRRGARHSCSASKDALSMLKNRVVELQKRRNQ